MKTKITLLVSALLFGLFIFSGNSSAQLSSQTQCFDSKAVVTYGSSCSSGYKNDGCANTECSAICCVEDTNPSFPTSTDGSSNDCPGTCYAACPDGYERYSSGDEDCAESGAFCCVQSSSSSSGSTTTSTSTSSEDTGGTWTDGLSLIGSVTELPDTDSEDLLQGILLWILRVFILLAFISFVVAGVMYLLSGPDKNMAEKAKSATFYSIIAVVVALASYIIIRLIFDLLWGGGWQ